MSICHSPTWQLGIWLRRCHTVCPAAGSRRVPGRRTRPRRAYCCVLEDARPLVYTL